MDNINAGLAAAGSFLSSMPGVLYIPVMLMVLCSVIDYATGLAASRYRKDGGTNPYKGMKGIIKKVCMWILVVVGAVLDELIAYTTDAVGVEVPVRFLIAGVVSVWIICNELISILKNVADIGVDMPAFLLPLVKRIKKQTEEKITAEHEATEHAER